jgi:hypothetical protein
MQHVSKALLHFSLNHDSFPLDVFHLLLDDFYALLQDSRVKYTLLVEHVKIARAVELLSGHWLAGC